LLDQVGSVADEDVLISLPNVDLVVLADHEKGCDTQQLEVGLADAGGERGGNAMRSCRLLVAGKQDEI
jgi:hypothetical protein